MLQPVRYVLSFPSPHTHYVEITAFVPNDGALVIEMMMAVWTPGSYLVREFSRHVEAVTATATDGSPLPVVKTRKNRWSIAVDGSPEVRLSYRVYGREMSVRTN